MTDDQVRMALGHLTETPKPLAQCGFFGSTAYALQARGFAKVSQSTGRNRARRHTLVSITPEGREALERLGGR